MVLESGCCAQTLTIIGCPCEVLLVNSIVASSSHRLWHLVSSLIWVCLLTGVGGGKSLPPVSLPTR